MVPLLILSRIIFLVPEEQSRVEILLGESKNIAKNLGFKALSQGPQPLRLALPVLRVACPLP